MFPSSKNSRKKLHFENFLVEKLNFSGGVRLSIPFLLTNVFKIGRFWRKNWKLAMIFLRLKINIEWETENSRKKLKPQGENPKLKEKTQPSGSSSSACVPKWCYKKSLVYFNRTTLYFKKPLPLDIYRLHWVQKPGALESELPNRFRTNKVMTM